MHSDEAGTAAELEDGRGEPLDIEVYVLSPRSPEARALLASLRATFPAARVELREVGQTDRLDSLDAGESLAPFGLATPAAHFRFRQHELWLTGALDDPPRVRAALAAGAVGSDEELPAP